MITDEERAELVALGAHLPEPVERCPDSDGDGVTGTSPDSPPCGTCQPGTRAERIVEETGRFREACRRHPGMTPADTAELLLDYLASKGLAEADEGGFDPLDFDDDEDGIAEELWGRKVRELPEWDRCGGAAGAVGALDLSDPDRAPFGKEWRLGLVADAYDLVCQVCGWSGAATEAPNGCPKCRMSDHLDPATPRPSALAGGDEGTEPASAGHRLADDTPARGAAVHHGSAAPAASVKIELHPLERCPDCGVSGRHFCIGKPSKGATGWSGKRTSVSVTCAAAAVMGLADPREAVGHAAAEEHVGRWHDEKPVTGPMRFRTKTKADLRAEANVERFHGKRLEVVS